LKNKTIFYLFFFCVYVTLPGCISHRDCRHSEAKRDVSG